MVFSNFSAPADESNEFNFLAGLKLGGIKVFLFNYFALEFGYDCFGGDIEDI